MIILYKVFINTMTALLYCFMAQTIYNFQKDKKVYIKCVVCIAVVVNIAFFLDEYLQMGFKALAVTFLIAITSYFVLKLNVLQAIVSSIVYIIALAVGDISAVLVLMKIYRYPVEQIRSDLLLSITSDLVIYGTVIIIIFLIRLMNQTQEMTDKYKRSITIKTSLYMFSTLVVISANYSVYIKFIEIVDQNTILLNVALMWIYLIFSLYINFANSALALKEQQYDQQQDYIATIDILINDYRRLKHSYANTIYSFYGYIQENNLQGLKEYYSEVIDDTKKMDSNLLLALQRIKVYAVFGLLWNKINEAESKGVEVGVQVINEVHEAGIKLTDLCEVLGNYLDNAIDAAIISEIKRMNIGITDDEDYITIRVENTCNGVIDVEKIQKDGFTTKGDNRGFGLTITNKILSKYTNVLHNTVSEEGIFKQELVIKKIRV